MAVKTRDEILAAIRTRLGDDTSDETLALVEDFTDTLDDYESKKGEDWKAKYDENDREWRKKYRDRFFKASANTDPPANDCPPVNDDPPVNDEESISFDDLFKESEV